VKNELAAQHCIPCQGGTPSLKGARVDELLDQIDTGWRVVDSHHLERRFKFKDFRGALDFTNQIGELAEEQGHHPDIGLGWGRVDLKIWTHKIDGLTESDFILAAKIDHLSAR
jgi:4a-hydroxytetrahydrobiopterin dehydratase